MSAHKRWPLVTLLLESERAVWNSLVESPFSDEESEAGPLTFLPASLGMIPRPWTDPKETNFLVAGLPRALKMLLLMCQREHRAGSESQTSWPQNAFL